MSEKCTRFLLVEDNNAHAKLVMLQLGDSQGNVVVDRVSDGSEALDYLHRRGKFADRARPDVVLLDLKLPKVDGHEVLRQLKSDEELRLIPVVVLTTSTADADRNKAYANYANSYITKPLDFEDFQNMMNSVKSYWASWNQSLG
ncbi:MAG TPA: response regulator [Phycisphaerae bacterium]|jgi:CheY-like chemotaxis protein|nr:response regulator [Phycisphaerae bacterium]HOB74345.1 response regulator [Phycisphaerae bacterium]HOJ56683.1 response regulator [Phycisphaerae bacterium]HOL26565.1 response regulator [Phycisphaerae bacterium]HPP22925.1 response regulator [Phycisphaerae bacterium]